jgi:hypothetical protein
MTAQLLIHVDPSKPFVLETNVSNFIVGVVFSQLGENNVFHLVHFYSHKFSPTNINYKTRDKELLTIMDAFKRWCHLFEGAQHEITVYLEHKNLQYFMTICVLNYHKARWALSLFRFQFVITYHFGRQ